jgi:hypothetical protein
MQRYLSSFIYLLIIFNLNSVSLAQISSKKTIAVIDLDTRGAVTQAEAGTLTDRLRSRLVLTGVFNVVERGKMQAILQEVGFQQTGCTSTECAIEVGKMLNVQQMVAGSMGKVGATYTVDIYAIDVATSQIVKSLTRNYQGDLDGLLYIIEEIAAELARKGPLRATANKMLPSDERPNAGAPGRNGKKATSKKSVTQASAKRDSKTWLWIGGGVIMAGGAVAAVMLRNTPPPKLSELPGSDKLPWPPTDK